MDMGKSLLLILPAAACVYLRYCENRETKHQEENGGKTDASRLRKHAEKAGGNHFKADCAEITLGFKDEVAAVQDSFNIAPCAVAVHEHKSGVALNAALGQQISAAGDYFALAY